jgi:endoglucanase
MLNYAVDKLKANPDMSVYLDGTHSAWLGAGDAADRLYQAGVLRADGFYLNVSNYVVNQRLEKYGTWVAKCIWFGDPGSGSWGGGHFEYCASQYFSPNGPVDPNDFSTWVYTDQWYADNVENQSWVPYPGDAGEALLSTRAATDKVPGLLPRTRLVMHRIGAIRLTVVSACAQPPTRD